MTMHADTRERRQAYVKSVYHHLKKAHTPVRAQEIMARVAKTSRGAVWHWIKGNSVPTGDRWLRLQEKWGTPQNWKGRLVIPNPGPKPMSPMVEEEMNTTMRIIQRMISDHTRDNRVRILVRALSAEVTVPRG